MHFIRMKLTAPFAAFLLHWMPRIPSAISAAFVVHNLHIGAKRLERKPSGFMLVSEA